MGKRSGPRRGSLAYYPRKKAKRIYGTVRSVPERMKNAESPQMCAFACYKAGMTHIATTDTSERSPSYGKQISLSVTIFDCPPLAFFGIRVYTKTPYGLKTVSQVYADKLDKSLARKFTPPKKYDKTKSVKKIEDALAEGEVFEIRALVHTQPVKIKMKKTPEVLEIPVYGAGNDMNAIWKYCQEQLGKEIPVSQIFKDGDFVDATAITKGKGTQGPVKRFGIKIQRHKAHGHRRLPGSIGAWTPSRVLWTVPMSGQVGFQRRTDVNNRVLKVGEDGKEVTPKGGFVNYGEVRGSYLIVRGSVSGPRKRMVILKHAIRKDASKIKIPSPAVDYVSLVSQKGHVQE